MGGVNDAVRYQVSGFLEKRNSQKKANIAQAHFVLNNNSVSIVNLRQSKTETINAIKSTSTTKFNIQ